MDKDKIVLVESGSNKKLVYNSFTFREILKGVMIKYAHKTKEEAEAIIVEHDDFFLIKSYDDACLVSHEIEYHWAMLWACGVDYHTNGYSYPPPDDYDEWELEYRENNRLAKECFEFLD